MERPTGRREASKRATRTALTGAARRLFAQQGYDATTVADIAREAGVTERTFYRYFDGKEGLLAEEFQAWLTALAEAIRDRPDGEPPILAVRRAMLSAADGTGMAAGPAALWPFSDRPFAGLRRSAPRPLLRLEATVAGAVAPRVLAAQAGEGPAGSGDEFGAQVIARVAVAALRSAFIHHRELSRRGQQPLPGIGELLDRAFAVIAAESRKK